MQKNFIQNNMQENYYNPNMAEKLITSENMGIQKNLQIQKPRFIILY